MNNGARAEPRSSGRPASSADPRGRRGEISQVRTTATMPSNMFFPSQVPQAFPSPGAMVAWVEMLHPRNAREGRGCGAEATGPDVTPSSVVAPAPPRSAIVHSWSLPCCRAPSSRLRDRPHDERDAHNLKPFSSSAISTSVRSPTVVAITSGSVRRPGAQRQSAHIPQALERHQIDSRQSSRSPRLRPPQAATRRSEGARHPVEPSTMAPVELRDPALLGHVGHLRLARPEPSRSLPHIRLEILSAPSQRLPGPARVRPRPGTTGRADGCRGRA